MGKCRVTETSDTKKIYIIKSLIFHTDFILVRVVGAWEPIPTDTGRESRYTLDRSPVTGPVKLDKQLWSGTLTSTINLKSPVNPKYIFFERW